MQFLYALILGVVQGVTEFLPVSSSGHLVFLQDAFGLHYPGITLEIAVHLGTLVAVILVYWRDLIKIAATVLRVSWGVANRRTALTKAASEPRFYMGSCILLGSFITAFTVFFAEDAVISVYDNLSVVGAAWIFTAAVLWSIRRLEPRGQLPSLVAVILIGVAQAAATIPGVSRSGATIAAGMHTGLARKEAARFSFLLSIPAILGAVLIDIMRAGWIVLEPAAIISISIATVTAAVVGYISLRILLSALSRGQLHYFSGYLVVMGITVLLMNMLG